MTAPIHPAHARDWLFDLDNTLYPPGAHLFDQVERRMGLFIEERFGLEAPAARELQKAGFAQHGSTLRALMVEHRIAPEEFTQFIFRIDYSVLAADPALAAALDALPGRKSIFTNGSLAHAQAVLDRLGIAACFDCIFDIAAADWRPKPQPQAYEQVVARLGIEPAHTVMVEDIAANLRPAAALGMTTVWLRSEYHWARAGADEDHVHYVADELVEWLAEQAGHGMQR